MPFQPSETDECARGTHFVVCAAIVSVRRDVAQEHISYSSCVNRLLRVTICVVLLALHDVPIAQVRGACQWRRWSAPMLCVAMCSVLFNPFPTPVILKMTRVWRGSPTPLLNIIRPTSPPDVMVPIETATSNVKGPNL